MSAQAVIQAAKEPHVEIMGEGMFTLVRPSAIHAYMHLAMRHQPPHPFAAITLAATYSEATFRGPSPLCKGRVMGCRTSRVVRTTQSVCLS